MVGKQEWVANRAYYLWKDAGEPPALDVFFWMMAEKEYDQEHLCIVSPGNCPFQEVVPTTGGRHVSVCQLDNPPCGNLARNHL